MSGRTTADPAPDASDDEAEIRAAVAAWSRAVEARDAAGATAVYTDGTVLYDLMPPHRLVGAAAIREVWERSFAFFPETFRSEHRDLEVRVGGDVAFAFGLHRFVPDPPDHPCGASWMRVTACLQRIDGRWRVVHEHVSVPVDPETGRMAPIPTT
jgi:uncharacterized protein (TIGR02246 family)